MVKVDTRRLRMSLKKSIIVGGAVGVAVVVAGTVVIVKAVKHRVRRVLDRKMHAIMADVLTMKVEDFIPLSDGSASVFRRYIDGLDNKRLAALCALVQVGYHIKVSGISPVRPSRQQVLRAVEKFFLEERLAPKTRVELLDKLDTSDAYDALVAAFGVLSKA